MNRSIIGIVETDVQAETIVMALQAMGVSGGEISVLLPDKEGTRDFAHQHQTKAPEGAVAGASTGGVVGGTLGLLAGIGAVAVPGIGALVAAGPLLAAMSGAAAGAAVGGLAGGLIGLGVPEIEATLYEGKVRGGNILLATHVESSDAEQTVREVLEQNGAHDIVATSEAPIPKSDAQPNELP
jgi:hypothetical protein